ncbi:related to aldehyde dehydrogenase [Melanopsichium pennsylvanicum]|uniref:Related to aldehyde dehydrogenase n=2 Tax=Melanopsichium pennsylvanicum TaxID=63383 RepID=A0AAJ5C5Y0_9BASI|nr:related to aldehyde dehydrogenase [Melanopsichium pennsylvanicum 4]SNX85232.1 related to aldehyde dehydrogenase [Melanopsichium pennsylvanicum]
MSGFIPTSAGASSLWLEKLQLQLQLFVLQTDLYLFQLFPTLRSSSIRSPTSLLFTGFIVFVISRLASLISSHVAERGVSITVPAPVQVQPGWIGKILDKPHVRDSARPEKIVCYDPATAYLIDEIDADTPATIADKISKAKAAQVKWATSTFAQRRKALRTMQKWVVHDAETIARVAARDTGKTAIDAAFGELLTTCSKLAWTISKGEKVLATETRPNNLLLMHKICEVHHVPMGVVAACVSWNYSAHNVIGPIIASIFAGNSIVVKASELVAWSATYFIHAIRQCLSASGCDPELVQLVTCWPDAAEALTQSEHIAHITFIGSEQIGRLVAKAATKELTPVTLELGGKDPAILLEDADLNYFASTFMRSCFQGAGQNCIGIERFIVDSSISDKLVSIVEPRIKALSLGSFMDDAPFGTSVNNKSQKSQRRVDMGAMITDARFSRLEQLITEAVENGAKLVLGGKRYQHPLWKHGHYFTPTLLTNVTPKMAIANEELFAPIFLIIPFTSKNLDNAITIANSTRYGLGSSIFGSTLSQCDYIAHRLEAGMVNINDFGVSYLNQGLPFGGVKKSGYGRFAGPEGLLGLTQAKAVTRDRFFSWIRTGIPPRLDYPMQKPEKSWGFVHALVRFAYADGMVARLSGILDLILNAI